MSRAGLALAIIVLIGAACTGSAETPAETTVALPAATTERPSTVESDAGAMSSAANAEENDPPPQSDGGPNQLSSDNSQSAVDVQTVRSPIDTYFGALPEAEAELFAHAQIDRQADHMDICMRSDGFDWYREPRSTTAQPVAASSEEIYYGVAVSLELSVTGAKESGGFDDIQLRMAQMDVAESEQFDLSWRDCFRQANELFPPQRDLGIGDELRAEISVALADINSDPGFDQIWESWAACMRLEGLEIASRDDLIGQIFMLAEPLSEVILARTLQGAPPDQEQDSELLREIEKIQLREIEVWTIDRRCAAQEGTDPMLRDLRYRLEEEVLAEHGDRWTLMRASGD